MIDLTPACQRTSDVLMNVTDEQLNGRTPCEKLSLRDLVAHVGGLALAFTAAARKEFGELTDTPPAEGVPLDEDWRAAYPARLADLARAWREPAAWEGMSRAGGVDFPGEVGRDRRADRGRHPRLGRGAPRPDRTTTSTRPLSDAVLPHVTAIAAEGPVEGLFGPAVRRRR